MKYQKRISIIVLVTIFSLAVIVISGGLGFIYSGIYDIAARQPHHKIFRTVVTLLKRRAVAFQSRELRVPELNDPHLIKLGLKLYQKNCLSCHGAPGVKRDSMGMGLNPNPPPLEKIARDWKKEEIAWVITNGLKMAGMPAFGIGKSAKDLWALTAFVVRINTISPADYQMMLGFLNGKVPEDSISWVIPDGGWSKLASASTDTGKKMLKQYGCISCHLIPGTNSPQGMSGPPLNAWNRRHYIAGILTNTPHNLIPWIMNPQKIIPGSMMPDLDVKEEDALHIAKYLYSLE